MLRRMGYTYQQKYWERMHGVQLGGEDVVKGLGFYHVMDLEPAKSENTRFLTPSCLLQKPWM